MLTQDEQAAFTGMRYVEVDDRYRFRVQPIWFPDPETIDLTTSTGQLRPYLRSARVTVPFPEGDAELTIFTRTAPAHVFIPFRDATSGQESYAAHYLDVVRDGDWVILDFNRTYNPYCAYGDRWNCTLPPLQNMVSVLIPVGEKTYRAEH